MYIQYTTLPSHRRTPAFAFSSLQHSVLFSWTETCITINHVNVLIRLIHSRLKNFKQADRTLYLCELMWTVMKSATLKHTGIETLLNFIIILTNVWEHFPEQKST